MPIQIIGGACFRPTPCKARRFTQGPSRSSVNRPFLVRPSITYACVTLLSFTDSLTKGGEERSFASEYATVQQKIEIHNRTAKKFIFTHDSPHRFRPSTIPRVLFEIEKKLPKIHLARARPQPGLRRMRKTGLSEYCRGPGDLDHRICRRLSSLGFETDYDPDINR